jgi:hypothetical protein
MSCISKSTIVGEDDDEAWGVTLFCSVVMSSLVLLSGSFSGETTSIMYLGFFKCCYINIRRSQ